MNSQVESARILDESDEFESYLQEALKDPNYRAGYEDALRLHRLLDELVARRRNLGLTQKHVADRMGVRQPAVSGFETESSDPKISTVQRYARAVNARVTFALEPADYAHSFHKSASSYTPSAPAAISGPQHEPKSTPSQWAGIRQGMRLPSLRNDAPEPQERLHLGGLTMDDLDLLRKASRLAARVEMRDVRMVRNASDTFGLPQPGLPLSYNHDVNPSVQIDEEQGVLVVEIAYKLTIAQEIEEESTLVAEISATMASLYEVALRPGDEPFSEDEVLAFGQTTGALGLYPYWREFVYSMTGRLALPALTLGVFQVEFRPQDAVASGL